MNIDRKIMVILGVIAIILEIPLFWTSKDFSDFVKIVTIVITLGFVVIVSLWEKINKNIVFQSPIILRKSRVVKQELSTLAESRIDVYLKKNLPKFEELFTRIKSEICILGITLESLRQLTPNIETALRSNIRIRVLILDSQFELMNRVEELISSSGLSQDTRTLETLELSKTQPPLTAEQKANLMIRKHKQIPTHSIIIIDPHISDFNYMQTEPYLFNIPSGERRVFIISRNKHPDLFSLYLRSFENLWNTAEPIS
jgi:hypothetical protein